MTEQDRETRPIPVHGRDITVQKLIDTQLLLLNAGAQLLQRPNIERDRKLKTANQMFKILRSAVPNEDDQEYLEDLMAEGKLDLRELLSFVNAFDSEEDGPTQTSKPGARRARTPAKRA